MGSPTRTYKPFVPETVTMRELTLRAVLARAGDDGGAGAANAYLGLRAGITIAATYPAAVISMAVLRGLKGSLLEENIARTAARLENPSRRARSLRFRRFCLPMRGHRLDSGTHTGDRPC